VKRRLFNALRRAPDQVIGVNYLERWHLVPRNRFLNIYLHRFLGSDDSRALHDHPWYSVSVMLKGEMIELSDKGLRRIPRFFPIFRTAKFAHQLTLVRGPVWTIFITGPRIREWGFYCKGGWRHWRVFGKSGCD